MSRKVINVVSKKDKKFIVSDFNFNLGATKNTFIFVTNSKELQIDEDILKLSNILELHDVQLTLNGEETFFPEISLHLTNKFDNLLEFSGRAEDTSDLIWYVFAKIDLINDGYDEGYTLTLYLVNNEY